METRVKIRYKNYKGELGDYIIYPLSIYFGSNEFHPEQQWLLRAHKYEDMEDTVGKERNFAMKDIIAWW